MIKTTLMATGLLAGFCTFAEASLPHATDTGGPVVSDVVTATPGLHEARRGRGADDPAGHKRRGRGADDAPNHG